MQYTSQKMFWLPFIFKQETFSNIEQKIPWVTHIISYFDFMLFARNSRSFSQEVSTWNSASNNFLKYKTKLCKWTNIKNLHIRGLRVVKRKNFKACFKPFLPLPPLSRFHESRSLAITQRTQRRATHIIMGLNILLRVNLSLDWL